MSGQPLPDLGDREGNAPDHFFSTFFRLAYFELKRPENDQISEVKIRFVLFVTRFDWERHGGDMSRTKGGFT
jgi:hypothetical protein